MRVWHLRAAWRSISPAEPHPGRGRSDTETRAAVSIKKRPSGREPEGALLWQCHVSLSRLNDGLSEQPQR
jgi:hypothetical protein